MAADITLRAWQARFRREFLAHQDDDFLLVACPAAGKTLGAAVGIAAKMQELDCDQLIVVCPTIVVRGQWAQVLDDVGFSMRTGFHDEWPEWVHGVCATYAQIGLRAEQYAAACQRRRTAVVLDEIHHAGESFAWGDALPEAFGDAVVRLSLSGTPFRSDLERIPFLSYGDDGYCRPDFAYDYPRAVRDGVCRPIRFHAHDGEITWNDDDVDRRGRTVSAADWQDGTRTARFSHTLKDASDGGRRLRASLDPDKPYLKHLLAEAHLDLLELRRTVPDAAGLVVCDSQAHAWAIDELLSEVTGSMPVVALSDLPRSHQAIRQFATDTTEWLVSVRMVAEGVDIPRLGVIAWATAAKTELMVRQVAGRALRSRGEHAHLPAIVHIPADPTLVRYAEQLHVMAGSTPQRYRKTAGDAPASQKGKDKRWKGGHRRMSIDATPFVEWFDRMAGGLGSEAVLRRCGLDPSGKGAGMRMIHRWRCENPYGDVFTIYDACHMAGISFDVLFADDKYFEARLLLAGELRDPARTAQLERLRAVAADAVDARAVTPDVPEGPQPVQGAPETVAVATPELPPSPAAIREAEEARQLAHGDVLRLLNVYAELRRSVEPGYLVAAAHGELVAEFGPITLDTPDELVDEALHWLQERTSQLAAANPQVVVAMARARRRRAIALQAHA